MSRIASGDARGMTCCRLIFLCSGIVNILRSASLRASGQSLLSGFPRIIEIFWNWSISEEPGNRGLNVYSSAMMQPKAKMSTG